VLGNCAESSAYVQHKERDVSQCWACRTHPLLLDSTVYSAWVSLAVSPGDCAACLPYVVSCIRLIQNCYCVCHCEYEETSLCGQALGPKHSVSLSAGALSCLALSAARLAGAGGSSLLPTSSLSVPTIPPAPPQQRHLSSAPAVVHISRQLGGGPSAHPWVREEAHELSLPANRGCVDVR